MLGRSYELPPLHQGIASANDGNPLENILDFIAVKDAVGVPLADAAGRHIEQDNRERLAPHFNHAISQIVRIRPPSA